MFKQFIDIIPGADLYMIASMFIFITFFVLVGIYLWKMDKNKLEVFKKIPFDNRKI